jgi:hypothetical protein
MADGSDFNRLTYEKLEERAKRSIAALAGMLAMKTKNDVTRP